MSQSPAVGGRRHSATLALLALGVVYGDIGTSPLYALRECFAVEKHGVAPSPVNVLGVLSLVFWTLIVIVAVKYLIFVMRADNRGEGGILAANHHAASLLGRSPADLAGRELTAVTETPAAEIPVSKLKLHPIRTDTRSSRHSDPREST